MKVVFEHFEDLPKEQSWLASIEDAEYKGMCETGESRLDAFNQLMISLNVKIAHDNNIELC